MKNLNYGVIGNCRSAALVNEHGYIDWCCLPDFDSPSVFARLLDEEKGGTFGLLVENSYSISQRYLGRTNVLITLFDSAEGAFELIDFMPRYKTADNEYFSPAEIYRYIRLLSGNPKFRVVFQPVLNYGRDEVSFIQQDRHIKAFSKNHPTDCLYLYTQIDIHDVLEGREIKLKQNEFFLLSYNQKLIDIDNHRVYLEYQRTKVYWLNWTNRSKKFESYTEEIIRSLLVLKIMTYEPTGAILAALTTSLPETIGEVRNWDYRFCWLRDASMSIETLLKLGHRKSAQGFLNYIKGIIKTKYDSFQIMYGIRGERTLTEEELTNLEGYEHSRPVRIGNAAYSQRQNDVFGYLLNVIYQYYEFFPGTLDEIEDMWEIVRNIMRAVTTQWEKPDKGIWEMRNNDEHFVFSKIMSWVAMDRAAKIARLLNQQCYSEIWQSTANEIKKDVLKNGWKDSLQTFTQTYQNNDLDASLLLMAEYGFIAANDPMFIKTVKAIKKELFFNGLMFRYKNRDDFGTPSSSFTICTFWIIQALYHIGEKEDAKSIFNDLLGFGNHLGLYSEDIDFNTKRLLGNFPQAYSHLALINTAILFSEERYVSKFIKP